MFKILDSETDSTKISKAKTKLYYEFNEQNDIQQTFKSAMSIWTED